MRIDLNADIGESIGDGGAVDDTLLTSITSGSVACGFHAGNPSVMRATVRKAAGAGVAVGAHPGFADLVGFGRRAIAAAPQEVFDLVLYQIGALHAIAKSEEIALQHVKPHGALYNMSARSKPMAEAIAAAVAVFDDTLVLIGPPESELFRAGHAAGLQVATEAFADRSYEPDGSLTPRTFEDAVILDPAAAAARALRIVRHGNVAARDGSLLSLDVQTICVHGDTPGAPAIAAAVRAELQRAGITVCSLRSG